MQVNSMQAQPAFTARVDSAARTAGKTFEQAYPKAAESLAGLRNADPYKPAAQMMDAAMQMPMALFKLGAAMMGIKVK